MPVHAAVHGTAAGALCMLELVWLLSLQPPGGLTNLHPPAKQHSELSFCRLCLLTHRPVRRSVGGTKRHSGTPGSPGSAELHGVPRSVCIPFSQSASSKKSTAAHQAGVGLKLTTCPRLLAGLPGCSRAFLTNEGRSFSQCAASSCVNACCPCAGHALLTTRCAMCARQTSADALSASARPEP